MAERHYKCVRLEEYNSGKALGNKFIFRKAF